MSKLSILRLMKNEVRLLIGFDKLSNKSIEDAKSYFKDYGFTLKIVDYQVDNKGKLTNIELSLLEDGKIEKQKNRGRNYEMYNDGGRFDLVEFRKLSKEDKGMFLSISANKETGIHTVNLAHIKPAPPKPPLSPKVPSAPRKTRVKIGMNNTLKSEEINILQATVKGADIREAMKIDLTYKKCIITFDGKKIDNGKFLGKSVTQKNWQNFLDFINNDDYFSSAFRKKMIPHNWTKIKVKSDKIPVTFISHDQANEYCKWQSEMFSNVIPESQNPNYQEILTSNAKARLAFKCRLPTEKEWEMATKKKLFGEDGNQIGFYTILEMPSI